MPKSTLNKWTLTVDRSLQHNNGLYVDILEFYGMLNGDITTAFIKNTAKLNDTKTFSASATVGKEFATGIAGIKFEPQIQLIYQQLSFDTLSDAANLGIDIKDPPQWMARIGKRLRKIISTENNRSLFFFFG